MNSQCSISQLLAALKDGDLAVIEHLWTRFAVRLVALARRDLQSAPKTGGDEEDIAQSVFRNICRGAMLGRLQNVKNRDELWWLLIAITKKKVIDHIRRETAERRGGGRVACETDLAIAVAVPPGFSLTTILAEEPTPEFLVMLDEQMQRLLGLLRDDVLRRIAIARIEGYTVQEIAQSIGISDRSIERKLQLIRKAWTRDMAAQS
ncbi:MAG TPA: ECF-type sigma factor [Lacipirellula sp.]